MNLCETAGAVAGATTSALSITNVQTTNASNYAVVITNSVGAVTSSIATLTVWVPISISSQPQSLTNIVLQAQIVERLMSRDPAKAATEVHQLIAMVQRTLDATKTFIFDVRPMVLDDLGLVPTLRRASRDRGRRMGVTVEFESVGVDRRMPVELESGLFRMLDDALAAHVAGRPDRLSMHLDWGERLQIELTAGRAPQSSRRLG